MEAEWGTHLSPFLTFCLPLDGPLINCHYSTGRLRILSCPGACVLRTTCGKGNCSQSILLMCLLPSNGLLKQNKGLCVFLWSNVDSPVHHDSRRQRRIRPEALPVGLGLAGAGEGLCFRALGRGCIWLSCWPVQCREDTGCICLVSMYPCCQAHYVPVLSQ